MQRTVDLPTGTVTFLFTDIEGSTRLLQALGAAYPDLLSQHHHLLRGAVEEAGGVPVGTEGDSLFAAFDSPVAAVSAAVAAQRAMAGASWPGGTAVRVRMGLHTGEGLVRDGTYVGLDVHRAKMQTLAAILNDPRYKHPELIDRMIGEGRLGKKVGKGFYAYDDVK